MALLLVGCTSTPNQPLNTTLSEVAAAAASETREDNRLDERPMSNNRTSNTSVSVNIATYTDSLWNDSALTLSDWRFTLFSHRILSQRLNGYQLDHGYQLSAATRDSSWQLRFNGALTPGIFTAPHSDGLKNLYQFDLSADASYLVEFTPITFEYGGRIGIGSLGFNFNQPIVLGDQQFSYDSISLFYLGLPIGMSSTIGPVTLEALFVPTFNILGATTDIGFNNDITRTHWAWPVSLGVGWQF